MDFSVSVIIPAYNVEKFIEKAVQSVLLQSNVHEIIVIDDGSSDSTFSLVRALQEKHDRLKIYQHDGKINKGRSASRNLGIKKATLDYVAFLDADDYYYEDRFLNDQKIFEENGKTEGVYNAVGFYFYRDATDNEKEKLKMSTVSKNILPEELFNSIVCSKYGYLHLNGLTVKKSIFDVIGFFDESLVVAEDSDILFKMALKCQLDTGIIDRPLAIRGVHDANIFTKDDLFKIYNIKLYESILTWSIQNKISIQNIDTILKWLWFFKFREKGTLVNYIRYWIYLMGTNPRLLRSTLSIKYFPLVRLRKKLFPFLYRKR